MWVVCGLMGGRMRIDWLVVGGRLVAVGLVRWWAVRVGSWGLGFCGGAWCEVVR